jgi:hypothetical protein
MSLWINAGFGRSLLNLLAVLVKSSEEENVSSPEAPVTGEDVGRYGGVGVADVRHVVHVIDRRCDVEAIGMTHVA